MVIFTKIKDLLSLSSGNLISSLIYGLFWIFLASLFTNEEYGELGLFMSVAKVGSSIALLGLGGTILVYEAKNQNIFPASFVIVLISSTVTSIVAFVLTQNFMASLLLFGLTIFSITLFAVNAKKRYGDYSIYLILRAIITVVLSFIFFQFFGIHGILLGYFIATLMVIKELRSLLKNKKIDFSILRSKFNFTSFSFGNRVSQVLLRSGDKILIGSIFGFSMLGNYYFAFQVFMLLDTIPRSILHYLVPQEAEGKKNKKLKIISIIAASIISVISIILTPIVVMALLPQYQDSIISIQILSIAVIPLSISGIQQAEFFGKENSRFVLIGSVFQSGLYIVLIVLLGSNYGLLGVAVGFLISAITRTIFNLFGRNNS